MDLPLIWFILIAVLWTGYLVLEGFDFGEEGSAAQQSPQPWSTVVVDLHGIGIGVAKQHETPVAVFRSISLRVVQHMAVKEQTLAGLHGQRDAAAVVYLQLDRALGTAVLVGMLVIRLSVFVAAGNETQAAVFDIGVIQRGQAGNGVVGLEFAVHIVLMPGERHGVATHFEGQL
mgnify:CR=1 FL=1